MATLKVKNVWLESLFDKLDISFTNFFCLHKVSVKQVESYHEIVQKLFPLNVPTFGDESFWLKKCEFQALNRFLSLTFDFYQT